MIIAILGHLVDLVKKTENLSVPAATIQTLAEFSQRSKGKISRTVYPDNVSL
jgi:hypothetical protein